MKYMLFSSVLQDLCLNLSPFVVNVIAKLKAEPDYLDARMLVSSPASEGDKFQSMLPLPLLPVAPVFDIRKFRALPVLLSRPELLTR